MVWGNLGKKKWVALKWVALKWVSGFRGSGSGRKKNSTMKCDGEKWVLCGGVFDELGCAFFIVNWVFENWGIRV